MLTQGLDHVAVITKDSDRLQAFYIEMFGATDGTVTDFGRKLSLFFRDPDRMECEVLVANPEPGKVPVGSASHLYP